MDASRSISFNVIDIYAKTTGRPAVVSRQHDRLYILQHFSSDILLYHTCVLYFSQDFVIPNVHTVKAQITCLLKCIERKAGSSEPCSILVCFVFSLAPYISTFTNFSTKLCH